jgi:hypothetical protein
MDFCNSNKDWSQRKKFFQTKKLHLLVSIKESYERKLAAISASISKLEEQIESNVSSIEN